MAKYTSIGGQALIEGIMMKSPEKTALAVRCPDKSIDVSYLSEGSIKDKCKILRLPVLRGVAGFIESMAQGYKAMMLSAEKSGFTDIEEESGKKEKRDSGALMNVVMVIASVLGDPNRLKQVFINIIDNAVKYTENGGQVLVDQTAEEGCVRITVKDTGVGIPTQDIDRVKEKFYKANKTVRGSGIGLAVADEIIKQHKGLLFIESTEGAGTTVTIVLPLYEPEPQKTEEDAAEAKENEIG